MTVTLRLLATSYCLLLSTQAAAQLPTVPDNRLGVDVVRLQSGQRLYGFILAETPDSLTVAIERSWLLRTYPKQAQEWITQEKQSAQEAVRTRVERISQWLAERPNDARLNLFLEDERTRISRPQEDSAPERFFAVITLPRDQLRSFEFQSPAPRKVAGLAFQHRLTSVTVTPAATLKQQLESKQVDVNRSEVDLTSDFHPLLDSPVQWFARKALVEHLLREPLEYQGTGNLLIRKSDQPDVGALVTQMLSGGGGTDAISKLGAELGLPEFRQVKESHDWWRKPCQEAQRDGFNGVMISRLESSLLSPVVKVSVHFFAKQSDEIVEPTPALASNQTTSAKPTPANDSLRWFEVQRFVATASSDQQNGEKLERLKQDPQIRNVLDSLAALGLQGDSSLLDQALKTGAATQQALEEANALANAFLARHTRALDSMPVPVFVAK